MIRKIMLIAFLVVICITATSIAAENKKEQQAVSAAMKWLNLVDKGKYAESWNTAARYFKNAVTEDQWKGTLQSVRTPLGKLVARSVETTNYRTTLPGAPDAQYVVIRFKTSFENKKTAIETVTPMMDEDGKWRVSGYYIK